MALVRLVYVSRATKLFQPSSIKSLLATARRNNQNHQVTGLLCFNQHCFLQCLEGPRDKVNETFHRILSDPRHSHVEIVHFEYIEKREYVQWNMGYLQDNASIRALIQKHSQQEVFNPYELSVTATLGILRDVRDDIYHAMVDASS
ncbi:BLUF domain-containing protein [Marinomonas piezotolerans]|nr:BLUF domain-containing protein [Marinomonas piezotolerans]